MRCATLAEELRQRGATTSFICRQMPGDSIEWLSARGIPVESLPQTTLSGDAAKDTGSYASWLGATLDMEIEQVRERLVACGEIDWLVVDHYALDATWEKAMRGQVRKILCVDDLANRAHDCDLLLDQNYYDEPDRYAGLLPTGATTLLGPRYALVRPEFALWRSKQKARDGSVRHILLFMGGGDSANVTTVALQALIQLHSHSLSWQVDVVLGAGNPHIADIQSICADLNWVRLHHQANNMATLMANADLAIGAGGSTNWERACLGLPSLIFAVADNQKEPLRQLVEDGYVVGEEQIPSVKRLMHWLDLLLANPAWLHGLGKRSATLVDGEGVRRVANWMLSAQITFRHATIADSENVWRWRNTATIRFNSSNPREIELDSHKLWFEKTLQDPHRILLIAEWNQKPIGVVRFDLDGRLATVSVFRVPDIAAPGGLVRAASRWLMQNRPDLAGIRADVLLDNSVSLASFLDAGYRHVKNTLLFERGSNAHV
jgi:UDP-2,4-diacetamido-2,4,6-trideoxy-beta-L-altropyranose hydrolase